MTKSLILLILYSLLPFHDFHVSHTTLHYNTAQESIEITVRVAIDDLEKTLETKSSGKLKLGSPKENKSSDQYIKNYFDHHLQISINEKMAAYNWIGKEIAKDLPKDIPSLFISSVAQQGLTELKDIIWKKLNQ